MDRISKKELNTLDLYGFSLIEVVVAMAILSIGILGVMQMGLLATRNITSGNIVTEAVLLAQSEIEKIRAHRSLADLAEVCPLAPQSHGYLLVSCRFTDPVAETLDNPGSYNCEKLMYDGSGICQAEVRVSWRRGGGGRGARGSVILKTMVGEAA